MQETPNTVKLNELSKAIGSSFSERLYLFPIKVSDMDTAKWCLSTWFSWMVASQ